jgi:hypothetical protein
LVELFVLEPNGQGAAITIELLSPQLKEDGLKRCHASEVAVLRDVDGSEEVLVDDLSGRLGASCPSASRISALTFLPPGPLRRAASSVFIVAAH